MTPYESGYWSTLEKLAVSPEMAQRAFTGGYARLLKALGKKYPKIDFQDASAIVGTPAMKEVNEFAFKYPLTNLRSQGIQRAGMAEGRQQLGEARKLMESLGVV